jgi:hypothetical protein
MSDYDLFSAFVHYNEATDRTDRGDITLETPPVLWLPTE